MSESVILTPKSWNTIQGLIREKYPPSVLLSRDKMKRVLGFTNRRHKEWHQTSCYVHLDFYDEPKRTMFLLKYCDYIEIGKNKT